MPFGGVELVVLLVIILLFFGAKRVPELARSLGVGARELKKAASEDDENQAVEPNKVEAREQGGEKKKPSQQEDARPEEQNVRAEPDSKAQRSGA
jgi:sec-independent protein translocase protein TatA